MIEECLRRREHGVAVDVVLAVLVCLIADAHRTDAAKAGQGIDAAFPEVGLQSDAIHRLQMSARGRRMDYIEKIAQIAFHGRDFGNAVFGSVIPRSANCGGKVMTAFSWIPPKPGRAKKVTLSHLRR